MEHVVKELGLDRNQVLFSAGKYPAEMLALLYNMADCTINVADAEGFGLATLESLSCETPVIVSMTGGLQQQVTDGEKWFGIGIEPSSKAVIGSQDVPYIYEDRINREDFLNALRKFVNMSSEEREALGKAGREYVLKEYNLEKYTERWDALMTNIYETCGSWENRKGYNNWELIAL
jgi:glycosyltransferase involved in cell wall biosynthesis